MRHLLPLLFLLLLAVPAQAQPPFRVSLPLLAQAELTNVSPPVAADEVQVRSTRIQRYSGYWNIIGEVINPTASPVFFVEITARLLDAGGQLVAVEDTFATLTQVGPGRRSPFSVYIGNPPATAAAFTIAVTDVNSSSSLAYRDVTILNIQARDNFGLEVFGDVRNPEELEMRGVEVVATFYDLAGNVVDLENSFTSPSTLAAGATGTYSLKTFNDNLATARVEVQAQGYLAP